MTKHKGHPRYAIDTDDTEFIDTPTCSALISLAIADEIGESLYFEFDYPQHECLASAQQRRDSHVVVASSGSTKDGRCATANSRRYQLRVTELMESSTMPSGL